MSQPYEVTLEPGKKYFWCQCGYTQKQPFCDGSHKTIETELKSLHFEVDDTGPKWLCGCKKTKNPPYCDGSHVENPSL